MPIIPTPPPMTLSQKIQKIQQINGNIYNTPVQQSVLDAQQIRDIAEAQAKQTMIEMMKMEQEKRKQTILTIENIDKIVGQNYSEWLKVAGVKDYQYPIK